MYHVIHLYVLCVFYVGLLDANTLKMPMGCTTNTCVSCTHVSIGKVDYMMVNTFMYVTVTLNYNKVMRIMPKTHRVVTIVEH